MLIGRRIIPQFPFRTTAVALAAGLSLSACAYGGFGTSYGGYGGYGNYGYGGGVSVGYSSSPYWGWNNGYYYPGTGYYVYDSYRRPYRWNRYQQSYWTGRQTTWRSHDRRQLSANWRDFRREVRQERREDRRERRRDRRGD